ncbi:hypothetical protein [Trueperella pyogenes]|uniref:hypothetical protein n=1 Tax=Trueperella pyogenes TaxID=1661 RepID=UPI003C7C07EF
MIADELYDQGIEISERRVWRLCSHAQVFSVITRRKRCGKKSGAPVHDGLLQCHLNADAPILCRRRCSRTRWPRVVDQRA